MEEGGRGGFGVAVSSKTRFGRYEARAAARALYLLSRRVDIGDGVEDAIESLFGVGVLRQILFQTTDQERESTELVYLYFQKDYISWKILVLVRATEFQRLRRLKRDKP